MTVSAHAVAFGAALSLALGAHADIFTYGQVTDFVTVSHDNPAEIRDVVDNNLIATVRPLAQGATIQKMPFDPFFPEGSEGYLVEGFFAVGYEISFNRTVACAPGFFPGPDVETVVQWRAYYDDDMVHEGQFTITAASIPLSLPIENVDRIEVRGFIELDDGALAPVPLALGDFFAVASTDCPSDRTGDGEVDVRDLLNFVEHWLDESIGAEQSGDNPARISIADLLIYVQNWMDDSVNCE